MVRRRHTDVAILHRDSSPGRISCRGNGVIRAEGERDAAVCEFGDRRGGALLLLLCGSGAEGAGRLKGLVVVNQVGGTPAVGVQVAAAGANATATKSLGEFELGFPGKQPGELVRVVIKREGWVVVNDLQLERELPRDPDQRVLVVLICKEGEREQWAQQFYRLKGREAVEGVYRRKLQELEQSHTAGAAERERLRGERDQALAQAEELARQLAAAKGAGESGLYRRALQRYLNGQVDEALGILSEARLLQEAAQVVRGYLLRGKLLAVKFQFGDAARAYEEAVRLGPQEFEAWFEYAVFHHGLNRFAGAERGYAEALRIARGANIRAAEATTLNNLGILHREQQRPAAAQQAYEEALGVYRELARTNPAAYRPGVAMTLNNLGILRREQQRPAAAQQAFEEALGVYRELARTNPAAYRPDVAMTLNNLGVLHREQQRPAAARQAFEEALALYEALASANPDRYPSNVLRVQRNLAELSK